MPSSNAQIKLRLLGRSAFVADAKAVERSARGMGSGAVAARRGMGGLTAGSRHLAHGLGAATAGAGLLALKVGKDSVAAFEDSRKVAADQTAALKSTGAASFISAKQLDAQSSARMKATGIDDEAIKKQQTLLLTFRHVQNQAGKGNAIFDRAGQAALDLSARFHKDLGGSAIMVGKALEDPANGLSALGRIGVKFTAGQKDQVHALVASGKSVQAQRVILRELEKQTAGSAAANATATVKMKTAWGEVEEGIGKGLSPVVDIAAGKLLNLASTAAPIADKVGTDITKIFGRTDLTGEQKLKLSVSTAQTDLTPLAHDLEASIGRMNLGTKLGDAVTAAAPVMADAMAAQVPHMASAFGNAFLHAGPGGQLLTAAVLASKFGAIGPAGRLVSGRFAEAMTAQLPTSIAARKGKIGTAGTGIGNAAGTAAGLSASAKTAEGAAGQLPASIAARKGKIGAAGTGMGGLLGKAAGAGMVLEIAAAIPDIKTAINDALGGDSARNARKNWLADNVPGMKQIQDIGNEDINPFHLFNHPKSAKPRPPRHSALRPDGTSAGPASGAGGGPNGNGRNSARFTQVPVTRGRAAPASPASSAQPIVVQPVIHVIQNDRGAWRASVVEERRALDKR